LTDIDTLARAIDADRAAPAPPLSDALVALAEAHAVDALLAASPAAAASVADVQARLRERRAAHELLCAVRDAELCRVLAALDRAGVHPVVIKGAHLAHVLYRAPGLRPRADTDLVIDPRARASAVTVLEGLGYRPALHVRGELIFGQWPFSRADAGGIVHALDLHWRIAAPLVFRDVLPAARLRAAAVPIPALGPAAVGPAPGDALLIACVHLAAHHRREPILLWLYEIVLLARSLDEDEARRFVSAAAEAEVLTVCAASLNRAGRSFDDEAVRRFVALLDAARHESEPSAAILAASGPLDELWLDVRVCHGWRERIALLREHLFPDRGYVAATAGGTAWLPWAYARRALRGARRWTR